MLQTDNLVTIACLHACAAQDVYVLRRTTASSGDSVARGKGRVILSKAAPNAVAPPPPPPRVSLPDHPSEPAHIPHRFGVQQRTPTSASTSASPRPPPPPPPPRVSLPDQPAEPAHNPHRFGVQQRTPTSASTSTSPRPTPSPPPPPPRFRLPEQQEEAAPPVPQRFGQQSRGQPSAPVTPPPPPPPPAFRSQPAEVVQPAVPSHRFAHERSTPRPLPAPTVLPLQPARKITPDVVSRSGDSKVDSALEEEHRRQAESAHYSFGSSVQDSINDNMQSRQETRDGLKTVGQYSYSDGFYRRTVHYEADDKGYRVIREETETIGDGPQLNPEGRAEVESNVGGFHNKYAITVEDFAEQEPRTNS